MRKKLHVYGVRIFFGLVLYLNVSAQNKAAWAVSMDWSQDGTHIAIGYVTGSVEILDASTTDSIRTLDLPNVSVVSVVWNPVNDDLLAVSSDSPGFGFVEVFDISTGQIVTNIKVDNGAVGSIAWKPDGSRLAIAAQYGLEPAADYRVDMFDADTGQFLGIIGQDYEFITSVAWSPDGKRIASGSSDYRIVIWEEPDGKSQGIQQFDLEGHSDVVNGIAWSPDGAKLASGSYDGTLRLWDTSTESPISTFTYNAISRIKWNPVLNQIALLDGPNLLIVDAITGDILATISMTGDTPTIHTFSWQPDGTHLAYIGSADSQGQFDLIPAPIMDVTPTPMIYNNNG